MKRHLAPAAAALAALLLALLAAGCRGAKSYRAERYDVDLLVHPDGAATITETVTFAFQGGPFTYAFREIPTARTGGIGGLRVYEEGQAYTAGREAGQYEVRREGGRLRVTWHFTPTQNMARTFVLAYRVAGLIRQEGAQDALRWAVIPPEHDYPIGEAQAVVRFPEQVKALDGARVLDGHAQPGMLGRQVSFLAGGIDRNQALVIGIWLPHGPLQGVPPAWQQREMAQAARSPLWMALAGLVLVGGLAGAAWAWRRHGREPAAATVGPLPSPPSDLPAGLAGALVRNGAALADALAALFDLARREALAVEEVPPTGLLRHSRAFACKLAALPGDLQPHEAATLQVAFLKATAGEGRPTRAQRTAALQPDRASLGMLAVEGKGVSLSNLAASLQANWRGLGRLYNAELYERQLFGPARDGVRLRLVLGGLGTLALGVLSIAIPLVWEPLFGPWPLLVTGALFLDGTALLLVGAAAARRTRAGEQAAGEWRAFRRYLTQLAHGRAQPDQAELYERYLAYAVAFGLEGRWTRQMAASGAALPSWFQTLGQEVEAKERWTAFGSLVAVVSAGSHGGAGGAAAGGAAGGGASGAG